MLHILRVCGGQQEMHRQWAYPRSSTICSLTYSPSSSAAPTSLCWTAVSGCQSCNLLTCRKRRAGHGIPSSHIGAQLFTRIDVTYSFPQLPQGREGDKGALLEVPAGIHPHLTPLPSWSHLLLLLCLIFWESLMNHFHRYLHLRGGFRNPNYNISCLCFSPIGASTGTFFL